MSAKQRTTVFFTLSSVGGTALVRRRAAWVMRAKYSGNETATQAERSERCDMCSRARMVKAAERGRAADGHGEVE